MSSVAKRLGERTSRPVPTGNGVQLLVVDDEPAVRLSLETFFRKQGFDVETCPDGGCALKRLESSACDVVLLDLLLPDFHGMDLLSSIKTNYPDVAVVVMSAAGTIESAVQAVKRGAEDFFKKPFALEEASLTIRRTLELRHLQKQTGYYRSLIRDQVPHQILGQSGAARDLRTFMELMAENADTTVLIEGESGVGKGLLARAIHARSGRDEGAFVEINCSSLSDTLLESELFGYDKGAFTGATARKRGLFEVADRGTLFLDEVSDMPLSVQPKLLTAIETGRFRRLGGTRDVLANVRVIASSNRSMKACVGKGTFREDLYYRLNVMSIEIPPLRRRKAEDIPLLTHHFLEEFSRARGRTSVSIRPEATDLLVAYAWPGNVRELRNVLERAVILSKGSTIGPEHLPQELRQTTRRPAPEESRERTLQDVEISHIRNVLKTTRGNRSRAARVLGLHRSTLIEKIKKYGLEPQAEG